MPPTDTTQPPPAPAAAPAAGPTACPSCAAPLAPAAQSCPKCGLSVQPASPAAPPRSAWQRTKAFFKRLGPAGPLALVAATCPPIGAAVLIGLITRVAPWLVAHKALGLVIFVFGFASLAALALLPTFAASFLAGWTFKFAVGYPASMTAFVLAALFAYLLNSRAAGDRVVQIVREHPKWEAVRAALLDAGFWKAFWIVLLIRLPPTSPFAAFNFLMGTIKAPLAPFLLGTLVGMAPRTGAAVWAASHASELNFADTKSIWSFSVGLAVTIAVVAIIGHYANQAMHRVTKQPAPADGAPPQTA
jgi:uncharacterized membrane protein YdjX (TVP38/TMEM64 family)